MPCRAAGDAAPPTARWIEWRTGLIPKSDLPGADDAPPAARELLLDWFPLRGALKVTLGATLEQPLDFKTEGTLDPGRWLDRMAYRIGLGYTGRRHGRRLRLRYDLGLLLQTAPLTGEGLRVESPDMPDAHWLISPLRDETGQPMLYPVVLLGLALEF